MSSKKLKKIYFPPALLTLLEEQKEQRLQAVWGFSGSPVGGHSTCHGFSKCSCTGSKRTCWGKEWLWWGSCSSFSWYIFALCLPRNIRRNSESSEHKPGGKNTMISGLDRKVEGTRLSSDFVPPSPVSLPALLGQDCPAIMVEVMWKGTDTGNSFMYC